MKSTKGTRILRSNKLLVLLLSFVHLVFLVQFVFLKCNVLILYNLASAILYIFLTMIYNEKSGFVVLAIAATEISLYAVLLTLFLGAESGSIYFSFGMLAAVFLFSVNLHEPLYKFIIMALPCNFVTFFIFFWNGKPFLGTNIQNETWYLFHRFSTLIVSICALLYLCISVYLQQAATNKENEEFILQLKFLSNHDTLTGLPNRRMLLESVKNLKKYSVAIFDVDDFKKINDTFGHEIGDKVLCGIVNCVRKELQSETLFGRWGGEEFLIIFPGVERKEIESVMNCVVKAVQNEKLCFDEVNVNVTVTAGVADTTSADNFDEIVAFADSLMYRGKLAGKNQVVFSKKSFLI